MRLSKLYFPRKTNLPDDFSEYKTSEIMGFLGIAEYPQRMSGFFNILPLGQRVMRKLENNLLNSVSSFNYQEMHWPLLQREEIWKKSGRIEEFGKDMIHTTQDYQGFVLSSAHEEYFAENVARNIQSSNELPVIFFQMGYLFENRKAKSIIRSSEFSVFSTYSLSKDEKQSEDNCKDSEDFYDKFFMGLGINPIKIRDGDTLHFIYPTQEGEHYLALENGTFRFTPSNERKSSQKGIGLAMIRSLGTKYASDFSIHINNKGKLIHPHMETSAVGLTRLLFTIVDKNRTKNGIRWPENIRPYDLAIVPRILENQECFNHALKIYNEKIEQGESVVFDDLKQNRKKTRKAMGIQRSIIVGDKRNPKSIEEVINE